MIAKVISILIRICVFIVMFSDIITISQQKGSDMDAYSQSAAIGTLVLVVILFIIILYLSGVVTKEEIAEEDTGSTRVLKPGEKKARIILPSFARVYFVLLVLVFVNILILVLIMFF